MSLLSKVVHSIATALFHKVEHVVDKAVVVAEDVAAIAEEAAAPVIAIAEDVASRAEALRRKIEARVPEYGPILSAILDAQQALHAEATGEKLDWRHSVVDTFKLAGVDSSFANRERWAKDFAIADYRGTAEQNVKLRECFLAWLYGRTA